MCMYSLSIYKHQYLETKKKIEFDYIYIIAAVNARALMYCFLVFDFPSISFTLIAYTRINMHLFRWQPQ